MDRTSRPELDYFRALDGPSDFSHRYVSEDAACGMAMLVSLGKEYQIPVPFLEALLVITQAINGEDYLVSGRTLENLGLNGLTKEELRKKLEESFIIEEIE